MSADALITELLGLEDPDALQAAIGRARDRLDPPFFDALARSAYRQFGAGDEVGGRRRRLLLELLLKARPDGAPAVKQVDDELRATRDRLLERLEQQLLAARTDVELDAMVSAAQPMIAAVLQRLERPARRELLGRVRVAQARVLRSLRPAVDEAARLLEAALRAKDPGKVLAAGAAGINDAFFAVLAVNLESARAAGRRDAEQALLRLRDLALSARR